jgi:hypothetical protein
MVIGWFDKHQAIQPVSGRCGHCDNQLPSSNHLQRLEDWQLLVGERLRLDRQLGDVVFRSVECCI